MTISKPLTALTSVKEVFNGSHVDPETMAVHGHDYEIVATWKDTGERFETLQAALRAVLAPLDHARLPELIWSAEDLGRWLYRQLGCHEVCVNRPSIGHFVTVRR